MSQANVESVKRAIDAFNWRDLDAMYEYSTPPAEWVTTMGAIEAETFRGRAEGEAYVARLDEASHEFRTVAGSFAISATMS